APLCWASVSSEKSASPGNNPLDFRARRRMSPAARISAISSRCSEFECGAACGSGRRIVSSELVSLPTSTHVSENPSRLLIRNVCAIKLRAQAYMPAEHPSHIPLLALAGEWASQARMPPQLVLRRLCEWTVSDGFSEDGLIKATGA